jgi:hypothetical protein
MAGLTWPDVAKVGKIREHRNKKQLKAAFMAFPLMIYGLEPWKTLLPAPESGRQFLFAGSARFSVTKVFLYYV